MFAIRVILFSLLFVHQLVPVHPGPSKKKILVQLKANDDVARDVLQDMDVKKKMDVWQKRNKNKSLVVRVTQEQLNVLLEESQHCDLTIKVLNGDVDFTVETELYQNMLFKDAKPVDDIVGVFPSYEDITVWLEQKERDNNDTVKMVTIGRTHEDRRLSLLRISTTEYVNGTPENGLEKPIVWIDGGIHAREWLSVTTAIYIINRLTDKSDTETQQLLEKYDFYVLPLLNPDGYAFSFTDDEIDNSTDTRLWRKDRTPPPSGTDPSCVGLDLNRNWNFHWNESGVSQDPCSPIYPGHEASSSLNTRAMADYIGNLTESRKVIAFFSLMAYGEVILTPWGYAYLDQPSDHDKLERVASAGVEAINKHRESEGTNITSYITGTPGNLFGAASGGSLDWAKGYAQIPYAFVIELYPGFTHPNGFVVATSKIIPVGKETLAGIKAMVWQIEEEETTD